VFKKYKSEHFVYWNIAYGIPEIVEKCHFEAILFHFTFFIPNINVPFDKEFENWKILKKLNIPKFAIIQDEYVNTDSLCRFLKEFKVETVFTCLPSTLYQTVYPFEKSGVKNFYTVLTGYIDEEMINNSLNKPHNERTLDVVYRARKMPYNLGTFGTFKWKLTEKFREINKDYKLKMDVSNDPNDFIFGEKWYQFVADSRTILGCEGGSGIHDPNGAIRKCCEKMLLSNPDADFETVKLACFKEKDDKFPYFAVSPRHFEAAASKTCQVLIEGNYNDILKPDLHYIPVKKDWSNLGDVMKKIQQIDYCASVAENAYRDIVLSEKYTYKNFVDLIFNNIKSQTKGREINVTSNHKAIQKLIKYSEQIYLYSPKLYGKNLLIEYTKRFIWYLNLDKTSWFKKLEFFIFKTNTVR
jgi:hypothetical protein